MFHRGRRGERPLSESRTSLSGHLPSRSSGGIAIGSDLLDAIFHLAFNARLRLPADRFHENPSIGDLNFGQVKQPFG